MPDQINRMNKLYVVDLMYVNKPPVNVHVYARDRGHALRLACMDAEANGWPKFANSHKITETPI